MDLNSVLKTNAYLDVVVHSQASLKAAITLIGSEKAMLGTDNGTDNLSFPPMDNEKRRWESVFTNVGAVGGTYTADKIMCGNTAKLLGIPRSEFEVESDPEIVE